jgi:exopolyphosphatase
MIISFVMSSILFPPSYRTVSPLLRSFSPTSFPTLVSYLSSVRSSLVSYTSNSSIPRVPLVGILGNEANDLDSMVSALSLAWFLHSTHSFSPPTNFHFPSSSCLYFPIFNIPRSEFSLRRDAEFTIQEAGIPTSSLIFLDDFPLFSPDFSLILVDHNELSPLQSEFAAHVYGVLDHHVDSGKYVKTTESRRIISPVGSCSTLVANWILSQYPEVLKFNTEISLPLLSLLLASIGIDTGNAKNEKTTKLDEEIYQSLVKWERKLKLERLEELRESIEGLTTKQILIKDNKIQSFQILQQNSSENQLIINISSVPALVETLIERDSSFASNCLQMMKESKWDILLIMGLRKNPKPKRRQILAIVNKEKSNQLFIKKMQNSESLQLKALENSVLSSSLASSPVEWQLWEQENLSASRKQVAPLVAEIASKL